MLMGWRYPRYIAHRCGGALTPENTLAGLKLAARMGFRAVEFDVMLSADGVPVLIHDESLERTTDGSGRVVASSIQQLRHLDAGVRQHPAFAGEPLPTLEQALDLCRALDLAANIEIKPTPGQENQTAATVARLAQAAVLQQPAAALLLTSFSEKALATAHQVAAELPRALLADDIPPDWQARLQRLDCIALHCAASHLHLQQVAEVTAAGFELACYTVNRPEDAARLFAAGVAAIFTDRLDLFDPRQ